MNISNLKVFNANIAQAATGYSSSLPMRQILDSDISLLVVSSAGSITVTEQCSIDNITWYDPVDSANTALGAVAAAMTVGSRYVKFTPILAQYVRFKIVEGNVAATDVVITVVFPEDI